MGGLKMMWLFIGFIVFAFLCKLLESPKESNNLKTLGTLSSIVTPFIVNHKVNQILERLEKIEKQKPNIDPNTGLRKFI